MKQSKTVTINGKVYDAATGLPVAKPIKAIIDSPAKKVSSAQTVHTHPQKSRTLNRRAAPKPTSHPKPAAVRVQQKRGRSMDIAKSSAISHFAPAKPNRSKSDSASAPNKPPVAHPAVAKAHSVSAARKKQAAARPKSAQTIKNEAIAEALAKPVAAAKPKKSFFSRHKRIFSVTGTTVFIIALAAFLVYFTFPSLSVRVAATRAGVNATYPEYRPDGYKLAGPISYGNNQVTIKFAAKTGKTTFSIVQSKSAWDSTAVRDNLVKEKAGNDYITTQERGLTIYTYDGNATWVNGGILYTIEGDAPLSSEQLRQIAVSL